MANWPWGDELRGDTLVVDRGPNDLDDLAIQFSTVLDELDIVICDRREERVEVAEPARGVEFVAAVDQAHTREWSMHFGWRSRRTR